VTGNVKSEALTVQRRWRLGRWLQVLALLVPALYGAYLVGRWAWVSHHFNAAQNAFNRGDFLAARDYLQKSLSAQGAKADIH
jgi:hypothetical protein